MKIPNMYFRQFVVLSIAFQLLGGSYSFAASEERPLIDNPAYTKAQRLVEVEQGRRLNIYCTGDGSPTILFESGLTDPANVWAYVQTTISQTTKACSYDRAGIGFSDPINRPSTSANMVDDLHRLLTAANIKPPYILVGHSSGGLNVRLFAHTYPKEIVGLVLVDPSDENQADEIRKINSSHMSLSEWDLKTIEPSLNIRRKCIQAATHGFNKNTDIYKKCSFGQLPQFSKAIQLATENFQMTLAFQQAQLSEEENIHRASASQLRAKRRSFGDMPLIILTETRQQPTTPKSSTELLEWMAYYSLWIRLHNAQAALSTRGVNIMIPDTGHYIQLEQPHAVEEAILKVLTLVGTGS